MAIGETATLGTEICRNLNLRTLERSSLRCFVMSHNFIVLDNDNKRFFYSILLFCVDKVLNLHLNRDSRVDLHCLPSQAFGFINLVLWAGNLWFIYRETGIIADSVLAPPPQEKPAAPDAHVKQGANEQETYTNKQAGYPPDCSQEGYPQVR